MIKLYKDDLIYYIQLHHVHQLLNARYFCVDLPRYASIIINTRIGEIVKCNVAIETLVDLAVTSTGHD